MENYEKKYKDLVEAVKQLQKANPSDEGIQNWVNDNVPELRESEDEKIRKMLIDSFTRADMGGEIYGKGVTYKQVIAWLEKQGTPNQVSIWKHWKDGIAGNGEGKPIYLVKIGNTYSLTSCLGFECDYIELSELDNLMLVKQGEQNPYSGVSFSYNGNIWGMCARDNGVDILFNKKLIQHISSEKQGKNKPIIEMKSSEESLGISSKEYNEIVNDCLYSESKSADNAEPKFKVGDWVVDSQGLTHQIERVVENVTTHTFGYDIVGGGYFNDNNEGVRLWTIQDAKDGDVLVDKWGNIGIYQGGTNAITWHSCCYCGVNKMFYDEGEHEFPCYPATKEQRNTLMKAMADAGWKFDFEKKELKKIEDKPENYKQQVMSEMTDLVKDYIRQKPVDKVESHDEFAGLTDFERTLADICIGWIGKEPGWKEYIKDNADVLLKIAVEKFNSVQDVYFEQKRE